MSCFRLMSQGYLDLDILADHQFSSEQTSFPITNIYNRQRRSKVWRSNGYWKVEAGRNTIIFRETIAVDLTATVAVGTYTATTLATAIKAALEVTGASTYTVTRNSNLKFVISSDGSGGGGVLQIDWTDPSSEDMAQYLGFSTANEDTGALTYTGDFLRIHAGGADSEYILWDFGIATNPDSFILIGNRNQPVKISPDAEIRLQGNPTNIWTSPVFDEVVPYDPEAMALIDTEGLYTEGLRFWRLQLDDQNPLGYIEIGTLFLGNSFGGDRGAVQFGASTSFVDRSDNIFSEGGQTYADIKEKTAIYNVDWAALTKEDIESITEIFDMFGTAVPFFVSMDTPSAYSSSFNRRIKYVKFNDEPTYSLESPNNFDCSMSFREEL